MKLFFKKAWIFVKTYWYIFAIIIAGIFALLLGTEKDIKNIIKLINKERENARNEVEIIEKTNKKQKEEIKNKTDEYIDNVSKLEDEYQDKIEELRRKRNENEKDLTADIRENPSKTLEQIAKEMGWDYEK